MHEGERTRPAGLTPADRLAFMVAERVGMTVGEVLDRMTTAEIMTWARLPQIDEQHENARSLAKFMERFNGHSR